MGINKTLINIHRLRIINQQPIRNLVLSTKIRICCVDSENLLISYFNKESSFNKWNFVDKDVNGSLSIHLFNPSYVVQAAGTDCRILRKLSQNLWNFYSLFHKKAYLQNFKIYFFQKIHSIKLVKYMFSNIKLRNLRIFYHIISYIL